MARTHRDDWIEAGLSLLGREGEAALTLERLCAALGRTKGSFYHHFEGMPALGSAMLAAWEQRHTDVPIAAASRERSVARRRRSLDAAVKQLDWALDLEVRAWARRDPQAREAVARVDGRRIAYLEGLLPRQLPPARRAAIATLEYCAFLGAMHLAPQDRHGSAAEAVLYEALRALIGPATSPRTRRRARAG